MRSSITIYLLSAIT
ncbi:hypothetical protein RDI58_023058 [Solanum bulbocastanum]|uniref:Uncharacterized protein n=1 Tax=Solanum bulbocastanum TaxID=147425 RepID=A0AAN8T6V4_SOLBU